MKPKHQYHLVDPSPWPIIGTVAALVLATGAVFGMHDLFELGDGKKWVAILPGLLLMLYTMYGWWKQVVREGIEDKAHTSIVQQGLRVGMALFILSEVMFFFVFFFSFFKASLIPVELLDGVWPVAAAGWPPEGIKTFDPWDIPFINTMILLLSGTTVTWAHHALLHGNQKDLVRGLKYTVILGVIFTGFQGYEYSHASFCMNGNFDWLFGGHFAGAECDYNPNHIYASNFFMATGFHGLHVIIGTIFLAVCLQRAKKGQFSPKGHLGFEFAAWYWHFVDVVWLFLFVCIYWWGG